MKLLLIVPLLILGVNVHSLDNGLTLKPLMGWSSRVRFNCETDCEKYPATCVSENLYKEMADRLIKARFKDAGYTMIIVDGCWSEMERDNQTKQLVADRKRFPNGIKALADYMHQRELKLGLATESSPNGDYFDIDAQTFAEWGIDLLKFDGFSENLVNFDEHYLKMFSALNKTGAPIAFHCKWPLNAKKVGVETNYSAVSEYCNIYRNYDDIHDSWTSIANTIKFYGDNNDLFSKYHGPGMWFDPDMLVVGDFGLSVEQWKTQMSFWAMWSSPLYMSNDLRDIPKHAKKILQNRNLIAINQDPAGKMAKRMINDEGKVFQAWAKELSPQDGKTCYAVLFYYNNDLGSAEHFSIPMSKLLPNETDEAEFTVIDLWEPKLRKSQLGTIRMTESLELLVKPSGSCRVVQMIKN